MPRGHYIKPNDRCERIQHAIWFDTETDPEQIDPTTTAHVLKQGWAAYSRRRDNGQWTKPEWFRFSDKREFWSWVEVHTRAKTRLYLFCHNTSFDLPVLDAFGELPRRGWVPDRLVIEAPPTIIRVKRKGRTLLLLDTLNWWRVPLAKLGESIGLPKLTMPDSAASQEEWDIYNRRDVEIIMRAVQQWSDMVHEYDLGGFQPTLASQSFSAWRHRFMPYRVLVDDNEAATACARGSYHGGRVEAFHIGRLAGQYHLLDINSMYPYVMQAERYPTVLAHYSRHCDPAKLKYLLRKHLVCAHVLVYIDEPAIGVYDGERYIFPTGTFEAHLTTPELLYTFKHGRVHKVYEVSAYEHAPIFNDFVQHMYDWRLDAASRGNTVLAGMIKILMNSLYGKFGQRGIRYEDAYRTSDMSLEVWSEYNVQTHGVSRYRRLMGVVQELVRAPESANSHPAIAAHVTAYARMFLWAYMQMAGTEHVYYCDTDSLLVDEVGIGSLEKFIHPTRLGALKHEGTFDHCEIYGAKDYVFGTKVRTKGVRSGALWLDPHTVEQEKWSGLKGLLKSGRLDRPTTTLITKHLTRCYDKGLVGADGRVSPFVLGQRSDFCV